MNELFFNWHKSLNIKKVIIVSLILLALIASIIFLYTQKKEEEKEEAFIPTYIINTEKNTTTFFDNEKTISIELSNNYNLNQYKTDNYLIELRNSTKNSNIFVSSKDIILNKSLNDVVFADKLAFTESFENVSNVSDLKQLNINNNQAYTYSFHYLDTNLNETFYIQITWIETNNKYYIFDIEFPLNDLTSYTNIMTDVLFAFKTL